MRINEIQARRLIVVVSVLIPLAVVVLLNPAFPRWSLGVDTRILPMVNAGINSSVTILLLLGLFFIKTRRTRWHQLAMVTAFVLSSLFLVLYVIYHLTSGHTPYCSDGRVSPGVYYFTLISHIAISAFIIPLAGFSIKYAAFEQWLRHRRLAKVAWPLWLYVSVTGVLVYLFNAPCYP